MRKFKKTFMIMSMATAGILAGFSDKALAKQPVKAKKIVVTQEDYDKAVAKFDDIANNQSYAYIEKMLPDVSEAEKKEFMEVFSLLPPKYRVITSNNGTGYKDLWKYLEFLSDKSGYKCVRKAYSKLSKEQAIKVQKMCMEILMFGKPLMVVNAENDTLEGVINRCHLTYAQKYYQDPKNEREWKSDKISRQVCFYRDANALIVLGKKYKHPDWIKLGNEMLLHSQPLKKLIKKKAIFDSEFVCPCRFAAGVRTR